MTLAAAYAHCNAQLRECDRDAWLACLFAPELFRAHLHALHLFAHEIAHVREKITAPLAGEIRLQWWRDAIAGGGRGEVAANPVAVALLDTIQTCKLPLRAFDDMIDARIFDLYDDPMPDVAALEGYCGAIDSALVRLGTLVLAQGAEPGGAEACGHAGMALGIVRILRELPRTGTRGQVAVPVSLLQEQGLLAGDVPARKAGPQMMAVLAGLRAMARGHLARAEAGLASVAPPARAAFMPLAGVEPMLRSLERAAPFAASTTPPQWRRQWALWRYAGRLR